MLSHLIPLLIILDERDRRDDEDDEGNEDEYTNEWGQDDEDAEYWMD